MKRQIYRVDAWLIDTNGVYHPYSNDYPKNFDSRNYGYSQLSKLLRAIPRFEVGGAGSHVWVKDKESK